MIDPVLANVPVPKKQSTVLSEQNPQANVTSWIDKHLFYPKPIQSKNKQEKKEKAPSAISSRSWRLFMEAKEKVKTIKQEGVQKRKLERQKKKDENSKAKKKRVKKSRNVMETSDEEDVDGDLE